MKTRLVRVNTAEELDAYVNYWLEEVGASSLDDYKVGSDISFKGAIFAGRPSRFPVYYLEKKGSIIGGEVVWQKAFVRIEQLRDYAILASEYIQEHGVPESAAVYLEAKIEPLETERG